MTRPVGRAPLRIGEQQPRRHQEQQRRKLSFASSSLPEEWLTLALSPTSSARKPAATDSAVFHIDQQVVRDYSAPSA
jgi:hypothetical protein